jgi:hypothetical protein
MEYGLGFIVSGRLLVTVWIVELRFKGLKLGVWGSVELRFLVHGSGDTV